MSFFPQQKTPVTGQADRPMTGASVLVIDDEASLREWLVRALPDRGYKAEAVSNAEEALEKIRLQKFDLIVCDIRMPGRGGVDLLKDIKRVQPDIEVIMATGYGSVETALESMKLGAYDYISKPFSVDQLCAILGGALAIQRSRKAAIRLQKNKTYLRWLWLLPLGLLLLWSIELVWRLGAAPPSIVHIPLTLHSKKGTASWGVGTSPISPVQTPTIARPQERIAKILTPTQFPPLFLHPELIPRDVTIVRCFYKYPIISPGGTLDFDIDGSGFSKEFHQILNVKSGTPEVWMRDLQGVTANQIHGHMTATPSAKTAYLRPYVFIHDQAVFQAGTPFAVIRPGDVLDILLVNADETGRAGKFRIYANLDTAMEKQLRIVPNTPEMVLSVPHSISPYVWEGDIQLKKITPGNYGIKVYIGKREIYENDKLIHLVKPNISKTGFVQKLSVLERHRRPGDVVTLFLLGSGFVPNDIALFKAHVNELDMGNAVFKYVSPGRLGFSFKIPPQALEGPYGVAVDKNSQPFYQQSNLFAVVPSNWLEQIDIMPPLSPGQKSNLRVKGRDFTPYFVQHLTIGASEEPGMHISGLHQVDADTLIADVEADRNVPPGDYFLHITAQGQTVKTDTEHFMVKVTPP